MFAHGKLRAQFDAFNGGGSPAPYRRQRQPVKQSYCILITPRSGSTWLSRRIARLNVLSCPEEFFNTEEFGNTLKHNPGKDIYEVFDLVAQKNCTAAGLFGFETSYFDLEEFEREARLLDVMPGLQHFFYLNRRNFVAQAISLYTAVETGVFHRYEKGSRQRPSVPYDDAKIMYWLCHILQQEYGFHCWLTENRIKPVRLRYEELLDDIDAVIERIAEHLDVDLDDAPTLDIPQTQPVTSDEAASYERVFRHRHEEFCRLWEAKRGTAPCPYIAASLM